jgi:RHS repeat-associated protein
VANQLPDVEGIDYAYDANGNLTGRDSSSDTFAYDIENRLIEAVVGGVTSTFTYNGDGLRMSLEVDDGVNTPETNDYLWDINAGLPIVLIDGERAYWYGLDLIASIDADGVATYYTYDGLGSTSELTDEGNSMTDTYSYDVFGAVRDSSGSADNVWQFTGEQYDEDSGLYYLRARYFDPATGRFLGEDAIPSANQYAYSFNSPTNFVDPYGRWPSLPNPVDAVKSGADKVGGAISDVGNQVYEGAKDIAPYAVACSPALGPIAVGTCGATIYTGVTGNYVDLNVSLGCLGGAFTFGVQYSASQGVYPYGGTGSSTNYQSCVPSGSLTTSLGQSITPGWNCGAQVSAQFLTPWGVGVGPSGQIGSAGVKEGGGFVDFISAGEIFYEAGFGVGLPGFSGFTTCMYVTSLPFLSW